MKTRSERPRYRIASLFVCNGEYFEYFKSNISYRKRYTWRWKISELKFWLKCRGDAGIRLKTKSELVKRVHDYIRPWFLGRTRYYFEHFIKFAYAKLFNWNFLENNNSDCEVLWTVTSGWPCNLQYSCKSYFVITSLFFFNRIGNNMHLNPNILNCREFTCWLGITTLHE